MKKSSKFAALALSTLFCSPAYALDIDLGGIGDNDKIPPNFAFCTQDGKGKTKPASNISPQVRWSGAPSGTKSYALVVVDKDVPTSFDNANQEGKVIDENAPRRDFYHWVLIDIPATTTSLRQGENSDQYRESGKPVGKTAYGINGQNDFASFMKGTFGGYDGPCPPWNDERLHHYHFRIYALDVETLGITPEAANGKAVEAALKDHTLEMAEVVGTYTTNPNVR